ncbi:hypothetical protein [Bacteroides thetaiotaomicron]|uniref:hypothetical protein n=1 Tax=Bacteroides thetaiotaomicron TaxID=818 RepID=UPI001C37AFEA|nr:hypothetical protein [Bacteroides thetaiotaomicron]
MPLDLLRYLAHLNIAFGYFVAKVRNILDQQRLLDIFVDRKKQKEKIAISKLPFSPFNTPKQK